MAKPGWPETLGALSWSERARQKKELAWKTQICAECGLNVHYLKNGTLVHDNANSAVNVAGIHLPWIKEKVDKRSEANHPRA